MNLSVITLTRRSGSHWLNPEATCTSAYRPSCDVFIEQVVRLFCRHLCTCARQMRKMRGLFEDVQLQQFRLAGADILFVVYWLPDDFLVS